MKASELIDILKEIISQEDDLEVFRADSEEEFPKVDSITVESIYIGGGEYIKGIALE